MASAKVARLTNQDIARAASVFRQSRQMPKWTVIVDGREFPARSLVLEAAGVPPNDSTNSNQAAAILKERGFDVRYQGRPIQVEDEQGADSEIQDLIRELRGSLKGPYSLLEDREREHRVEKDRLSR